MVVHTCKLSIDDKFRSRLGYIVAVSKGRKREKSVFLTRSRIKHLDFFLKGPLPVILYRQSSVPLYLAFQPKVIVSI